MKQSFMTMLIAGGLLLFGCASAPDLQRTKIQCKAPLKGGFFGFYSFTTGEMTTPPSDPDSIDLVYYFDGDDCSEGALLGQDDRSGYLFLIGHMPWSELVKQKPPTEGIESVGAIAPLTQDKEGLAFWVKSKAGKYTLVRIRTVQPASYSDLVSGNFPKVEFEWLLPRNREGRRE